MFDAFALLLALAALLAIPAAWIALLRVVQLARRVAALEAQLAAATPRVEPETRPAEPTVAEPEAVPVVATSPEPETTNDPPVAEPEPVAPRAGLEEALGRSWLFWIGGIALAFGGAFLVKVAIDEALIGPAVRAVLGGLLGAALLAGGFVLRLRPERFGLAATQTALAAQALGAGGVVTLLAVAYATTAVDALLPPLGGFILAVAACATAILASWTLGPLLALIGLVGGWVAPLLVGGDTPQLLPLFAYLTLLVPVGLMVARLGGRLWPSVLTLVAVLLWGLIAVFSADPTGQDKLAPIVFLLATPAFFVGLMPDGSTRPHAGTALLATGACGLLAIATLGNTAESAPMLWAMILQPPLVVLLSRWRERATAAGFLGLAQTALLFLTWALPLAEPDRYLTGEPALDLPPIVLLAEVAVPFARWIALAAALMVAAALWAMRGARRPGAWASLAVATVLVLLAVAYARIAGFALDVRFAMAATLAAGAMTLAASLASRRRPALDGALAAFAVGASGALALGATMLLEAAWLTVALAVLTAAIGAIWRSLPLNPLRWVAGLLAAVVVARAGLGGETDLAVSGGTEPLWLVYGLGVPAVCLFQAGRWLRRAADDPLAAALSGGAFVLWMLLLLALGAVLGGLTGVTSPLLRTAVFALALLGTALAMLRTADAGGPATLRFWAEVAVTMALLRIGLDLVGLVPFETAVGEMPVVNLLLLAFGLPIPLLLLIRATAPARTAGIAGVAALLLGLVWPLLEIRRAFVGPVLFPWAGDLAPASDAESWAYSAWIVAYAVGLLVAGIVTASRELRWASLAVLMLGIAKVFLLDMGDLEGLWRAGSFLGLGLVLVAIGLAYQRFVLRPAATPEP